MSKEESEPSPLIPNDSSDPQLIPTIPPPQNSKTNYTKIILGLLIGQLLSILSVLNGLCSQYLETKRNLVIPLLLTTSYYFLLFITWIIITREIHKPKLIYIILTIIDSQANFINVYTFSLIQFEYPFIINFSSSIWTFLLTIIFIKKYKYKPLHYISIFISFIGILLAMFGTLHSLWDISSIFTNTKGLLLCLLTSVLYASSVVLQEIYLDENESIYNYFPWFGIIGTIITFCESFVFGELNKAIDYKVYYDIYNVMAFVSFGVILVTFTSISPFFIKKFSALMFNIGLASTVFWSYIGNVIMNTETVGEKNVFYFIGFAIIVFGLVMFYYREVEIKK